MINQQEFSKCYLDKSISIKEIAEKFGISARTVYTWAKKLNLQIRSEKKYECPVINQRFNRLIFIQEECGTGHRKYWKCKCDCGNIKSFPYYGVFSGKTVSCGCYQREKTSKNMWRGFGDISGRYWSGLKDGAARRRIEFSVEIKDAWSIFLKQNRCCALSGLSIEFSRMTNKFPQTASLDRIDNSMGYTKNNIQWLHKTVNSMKHCMEQKYFVDFCSHISDNARKNEKEKEKENGK